MLRQRVAAEMLNWADPVIREPAGRTLPGRAPPSWGRPASCSLHAEFVWTDSVSELLERTRRKRTRKQKKRRVWSKNRALESHTPA